MEMRESKTNHCSEELTNFLRDFFQDIRSLISKLKSNAYKILNINFNYHQTSYNKQIKPNINSILAFCQQIYQDLNRTNSILQGYAISHQRKNLSMKQNKSKDNKDYQNQNNITFQNKYKFQIDSYSKTNDLLYDSLTLNSENDLNLINRDNQDFINCKQNQTHIESNKTIQPINLVSFGDCLIKRTNFLVKKKPKQQNLNNPNHTFRNDITNIDTQIEKHRNTESAHLIQSQQQNYFNMNSPRNENMNGAKLSFSSTERSLYSKEKSTRLPRVINDTMRRNSECLNLIRSIRKQLSR